VYKADIGLEVVSSGGRPEAMPGLMVKPLAVAPPKSSSVCRLHGGASGSGGPPGKRNGQYRHGERTKAAIAEQRKFSALLKMLRAGLT
jgi:hypothetical protein